MEQLGVTRAVSIWSAVGLMLGASSLAYAQASSPTSSGAGNSSAIQTMPEIVVTAEKRTSTVQRTPISITAITGAQLQSYGITTVEGALQTVPGVSMKTAGPGQTEIEMRGLGSAAGASPTVGFYLDDAALIPPVFTGFGKVVVDPDLYDLNRIEVLRGPQGTLYGSGSMGGTVRLITNQPQLNKFGGSIDLDSSGTIGGNVPNGAVNVSLNLPLIEDKVALRIVATDKYNSGWLDRIYENPFPLETDAGDRGNVLTGHVVADHKNVNWEHLAGERAELLVQVNPDLKMVTMVFDQDIRQGGANTYDVPPDNLKAHYQPANVAEPFYDKFFLAINTISYDFKFADLTATTSYWNRTQAFTQDFTETLQYILGLPSFITASDQGFKEKDNSDDVSEEIRLTSKSNGPFTWIAGVYYSDLKSAYDAANASVDYCSLSTGGCPSNPTGIIYDAVYSYEVKQYAVFGEATYKIIPSLAATVGLRYFDFQNKGNFSVDGVIAASGDTTPTLATYSASASGVTPKFNLAYEPNGNLTIYGTAAKGFREGGVNTPIPTSGPASCLPSLAAIGYNNGAPTSYSPDTVWSYELGEKSRLLNGNLTFNSDVYYITWKNIQQSITPACGYNFTGNVGDAVSYGPEFEVAYRLTDALTVEANGTYTHATLTKINPGLSFNVGQKILNIPEYSQNTSLVYRFKIGNNGDIMARVANNLVGPTEDLASSDVTLKAYDLVNARIQYNLNHTSYALYVNNLTNTRAQLGASSTLITVAIPTYLRLTANQPLTAGFDIRHDF